LLFESRQRIEKTFAPFAGVEFLQRFEFVVHPIYVIPSGVEESLTISRRTIRNVSTLLDMTRVTLVLPALF
jgi:hypothetical protein